MALILLVPAGGCGRVLSGQGQPGEASLMWTQSALSPAGPHAGSIATLTWVMFIGGTAIFLLVMGLAALAIFGRSRPWMRSRMFVIGFGIAFPIVTLTLLLVYGLVASDRLRARGNPALRIEVIGETWWWRVHYLGEGGSIRAVSANEIRVPAGAPVEFILKSNDVIHSFWVPNVAGKLDMIPGLANAYQFAVEAPGVYRGQCAEYCGAQHALMSLYLVAMPPDQFRDWYRREQADAAEPRTAATARGRELFVQVGCGACHTVRGTQATGQIGPDLTHVGSRLSIAAGTYPTNAGTLAAWISSSQHLKPGNLMPSFAILRGEELRAIAEYLESLE